MLSTESVLFYLNELLMIRDTKQPLGTPPLSFNCCDKKRGFICFDVKWKRLRILLGEGEPRGKEAHKYNKD